MSITQPSLTPDQENEIALYINNYRAKHQAPPMVWDNTIYSFSQSWSLVLSSNNLFQHSGNQLYGENLEYFQGYCSDAMVLIKNTKRTMRTKRTNISYIYISYIIHN